MRFSFTSQTGAPQGAAPHESFTSAAFPPMVSGVVMGFVDPFNVPGLEEVLNGTTPADNTAREWHAASCPPFAPEDVVSTFDVAEPPQPSSSSPQQSASGARLADGGGVNASATRATVGGAECPICLEPLFPSTTAAGIPSTAAVRMASSSCTAPADPPATAPVPPLRPETVDTLSSTSANVIREVYCGHRFHHGCILRWIQLGHYSCPLCRSPFVYE